MAESDNERKALGRMAVCMIVMIVLLFGATSMSSALAAKKTNTLMIWGDDIGWSNISAYNYGMMGYQTPNIDRIANKCLSFND